jgi:hypothetical protein
MRIIYSIFVHIKNQMLQVPSISSFELRVASFVFCQFELLTRNPQRETSEPLNLEPCLSAIAFKATAGTLNPELLIIYLFNLR